MSGFQGVARWLTQKSSLSRQYDILLFRYDLGTSFNVNLFCSFISSLDFKLNNHVLFLTADTRELEITCSRCLTFFVDSLTHHFVNQSLFSSISIVSGTDA